MSLLVRIQTGNPAGLDGLVVDALMLPMYELRHQPLGVAGYVDWRLCGRLARMFMKGTFTGRAGESVLMSSLGRFGVERIFLYGLGAPKAKTRLEWSEELERMFRILSDAKAEDVAIAPPELPKPVLADLGKEAIANHDALTVARAWLASRACKDAPFERIVLLDTRGELERAKKELEDAGRDNGVQIAV